MAHLAQVEARGRCQSQLEHHGAQVIARGIAVLLHHVFGREALQHAMHGRALQAGAGGEIEQAGTATVVRGDFAQQQQRALYALGPGKSGIVGKLGFAWHMMSSKW